MNDGSQSKLLKINVWFAEQLAYLVDQLANTPEPGGEGVMLDNTTVSGTNELGKGNSHTLKNIPFLLIGNGFGFKTGPLAQVGQSRHNRLWMSFAHGAGHPLESFGNPDLCDGGALDLA